MIPRALRTSPPSTSVDGSRAHRKFGDHDQPEGPSAFVCDPSLDSAGKRINGIVHHRQLVHGSPILNRSRRTALLTPMTR